jgi:hypothetical protein
MASLAAARQTARPDPPAAPRSARLQHRGSALQGAAGPPRARSPGNLIAGSEGLGPSRTSAANQDPPGRPAWRPRRRRSPSRVPATDVRLLLEPSPLRALSSIALRLLASLSTAALPACRLDVRVDLLSSDSVLSAQRVALSLALLRPDEGPGALPRRHRNALALENRSRGGTSANDPSERTEVRLGDRSLRLLAALAARPDSGNRAVAPARSCRLRADRGFLERLRSLSWSARRGLGRSPRGRVGPGAAAWVAGRGAHGCSKVWTSRMNVPSAQLAGGHEAFI